ncbi:winged helix-turn-helix domain-containing protein [Enterobacter mori]|uniref:winged helix-turn-helix domain-containing protein n=1 Tax=Enterobacter mori TaxID=539813 RepID=UPI001B8AC351|nr:hypothetical protein [Enterobacter mori]MBS3050425.1 hypothetical protein [Enterobacter mori]
MQTDELEIRPVLLSGSVIFSPLKRTLTGEQTIAKLTENEACLLKMLLEKTCSKREVMSEIWEKRGVIVTESSYYKLVRQLRKSFVSAGLDDSLIMTLPRIGISYSGTKEITLPENTESKNQSSGLFIKNKSLTVATFFIAFSAIGLISGILL